MENVWKSEKNILNNLLLETDYMNIYKNDKFNHTFSVMIK